MTHSSTGALQPSQVLQAVSGATSTERVVCSQPLNAANRAALFCELGYSGRSGRAEPSYRSSLSPM
jgi:hypothetical protein